MAKKSGALKWILIGCVGLVAIGLLCTGGCAGLSYWFISSLVKEVEPVGAAHLKSRPRVTDELGALTKIEAAVLGSNVQKINDGGSAQIRYVIEGSKGKATACVWLTRSGGQWTVVGYEVTTASGKIVREGQTIDFKSGGSIFDD